MTTLLPTLRLFEASRLVRPQHRHVVAPDVGLLQDAPPICISVQRLSELPFAESRVAPLLRFHSIFALLQQLMNQLRRLVELRSYLLVRAPRRPGDLASERLQRRHACSSIVAFRHAFGLRGIHPVVEHHVDHSPWLLANWRHAELRIVRAGDPGRGHMQRRGAIFMLPRNVCIAVQQVEAHLGIAGSQSCVERRCLHPRLLCFDIGAELEQ
mmetsp:Transcript_110217/g.235349  ORF Transcript_110217/g.235349 Transcript_110217/m.235349 type:complete len:212 (-) Transcript_110217:355-990(-)